MISTKRSYILKQTCSWKLQVCLSMGDLLVDTRCQRVKEGFSLDTLIHDSRRTTRCFKVAIWTSKQNCFIFFYESPLHILSIISRSKGNQTMKFDQLTEHNVTENFLQKSFWKWGREISLGSLFAYKKALCDLKANGLHLNFIVLRQPSTWTEIRNKQCKTIDFRDILNSEVSEKVLGLVYSPHFVHDFPGKMFFMLYFLNWPNFILCSLLLLEILVNMCIAITCFPGCDAISFVIDLSFLIKPFFYMTK